MKIGDKIKVREMSFMTDNEDVYTAYYPMVEADGTYMTILSEEFPTGQINAETRHKAKKLGEKAIKEMTIFY